MKPLHALSMIALQILSIVCVAQTVSKNLGKFETGG